MCQKTKNHSLRFNPHPEPNLRTNNPIAINALPCEKPKTSGKKISRPLPSAQASQTMRLTDLDLAHFRFKAWKKPSTDHLFSGKPLTIADRKFERGIGTRATGSRCLELGGQTEKFTALSGLRLDFLKYNWCSSSICGMGKVWQWGTEVGSHSWPTANDVCAERIRIFALAPKNAEYRDPWRQQDLGVINGQFIGNSPPLAPFPRINTSDPIRGLQWTLRWPTKVVRTDADSSNTQSMDSVQ